MHAAGLRVVSSLAGRVRDPALPDGEVRIGGFGGPEGLAAWLRARQADAAVDATHPFAAPSPPTPPPRAPRPACRCSAWPARRGRPGPETLAEVDSLPDAAALLPALGGRVFLTTGRQGLGAFAAARPAWFLIRCVDPPDGARSRRDCRSSWPAAPTTRRPSGADAPSTGSRCW